MFGKGKNTSQNTHQVNWKEPKQKSNDADLYVNMRRNDFKKFLKGSGANSINDVDVITVETINKCFSQLKQKTNSKFEKHIIMELVIFTTIT